MPQPRAFALRLRRVLRAALPTLVLLAGGAAARAEEDPEAFPKDGLMPKREIGADRFLAEHPTFDGRGITVAIFDTGVDPGAPGLQTTSDGRPKIVDLVDGSGSGDVDTSVVRKASDGKLTGLSGRTLTTGAHTCPTNAWHVGLKPAYELFPRGLVRRISAKRRKAFDERQRAAEVALERAQRALGDATGKEASARRADLAAQLEQLRALLEDYADPGPIYDCVVFHDGTVWRAAIDTDEDGDLGDEKALATYRLERQWSTFSAEDRLNYGINVYDAGRRLSIVADCGAHGTHVAGIVAAYDPDAPELNGIAPGAQIVAVKIGDTRTGSSSTGTGEERGLVAVLRNRCDLINMSYGGPTPTPNRTRMERLYAEVVNEHNVIFVASAGNEGPALSTVGAPGGTSSALFGVGAYVSREMMKAQYGMRATPAPTHYTWSSRGPTADGDLGVDFSAPGGAVAPVPNWVLQGSTQMHGTSMSSPNLCGGVALLLSGLKAGSTTWSPHRVRRALANTAKAVEGLEVFGSGRGLIQIPEAFEYLQQWRDRPEEDVRFQVTLPDRDDARGLYLREPAETERVAVERIRVKPHFREDEDHESRIAFSMRLRLEASVPWIETAGHLALQHGGGRFEIRVDPTALAPGEAHYGEVHGIDSEHPGRGPIFRLPVTVVRPVPVDAVSRMWSETLAFGPGTIERRFFVVPSGATWADLRLRSVDADAKRLLVVHGQQLLPGRSNKESNFESWVGLDPNQESVQSFKVTGDRTLELTLAQYWSSLGEGRFEAQLVFHGLTPASATVRVDGADLMTTVDVTVPFGRERLAPAVKLPKLRKALRPASFRMTPGEAGRDTLSRGRVVHEAVLTYRIDLAEDARVQPRAFQSLYEDVYESWSSALWMIFDENKRRVGLGPLWGDKNLKLAKGRYVLRLHLRHEDPKRLEMVRQAVLYLDVHLDKPVALPVYASGEAVLAGGPRFAARNVRAGDRVRLVLGAPPAKAWPKLAAAGDQLFGEIRYGAQDAKCFGSGRRPGGWPIWVVVPPRPATPDAEGAQGSKGAKGGKHAQAAKVAKGAGDAKDVREPGDAYAEVAQAVLELQVARLGALAKAKEDAAFDRLAAELLAAHPGHVPVLVAQLARADRRSPGAQDAAGRRAVVAAAERVLERLDLERLRAWFGPQPKPESAADERKDARMRMLRDALVEALFRKARVLAHGGEASKAAFLTTWRRLEPWADVEGPRFLAVHVRYDQARGRPGAALRHLQAALEKRPRDRSLCALRLELLEALGWAHWVAYEQAWMLIRFPRAYPPF